MLKSGILNPHINSLLARIRHTNILVIADRGFPFFPGLETVDISLVDDIPTVLDVYRAIQANFQIGSVWLAEESKSSSEYVNRVAAHMASAQLFYEPHIAFKARAAGAIGLIRTADTTPYANMIIESA